MLLAFGYNSLRCHGLLDGMVFLTLVSVNASKCQGVITLRPKDEAAR
jgi:hypothetical protein